MNTIPNLKLVDGSLEGDIFLPIWKDFQNTKDNYDSIDVGKISNGIFGLSIGGEMLMKNLTVSVEQLNAYDFSLSHAEQIQKSILAKLFSEYKALQETYKHEDYEAQIFMPGIENIEQFKDLIALSQLHILNVNKDGIAYVGYQFSCSWDDEHGLGFMTHKSRITEIGDAQTSFTNWIAKKDLEA